MLRCCCLDFESCCAGTWLVLEAGERRMASRFGGQAACVCYSAEQLKSSCHSACAEIAWVDARVMVGGQHHSAWWETRTYRRKDCDSVAASVAGRGIAAAWKESLACWRKQGLHFADDDFGGSPDRKDDQNSAGESCSVVEPPPNSCGNWGSICH